MKTYIFDGRHKFISSDGLLVVDEGHGSFHDGQNCIVGLRLLTQDLQQHRTVTTYQPHWQERGREGERETHRRPSEDGGSANSGGVHLLVGIVEMVSPDPVVHVSIHTTDDDDGGVEGSGTGWNLE